MRFSVCIITKDEASKLKRCLTSLKQLAPYLAEIIVIDTGSTDDSCAVASSYGAKVFSFEWTGDFAVARNFAAAKATEELVLMLDTDEWLAGVDLTDLEKFIQTAASTKTIGRVVRINKNKNSQTQNMEPRLYAKSYFNYTGKIHEQLVPKDSSASPIYQDIAVALYHDGYQTKQQLIQKAQRNLTILLTELELKPNDSYLLFQIGKCYYIQANQHELAIDYFIAALKNKPVFSLGYVFNCLECLVLLLLDERRLDEAEDYLHLYPEFKKDGDYQYLNGLVMLENKNYNSSEKYFKEVLKQPIVRVQGRNSFLANYYLGFISEQQNNIQQAIAYYTAAKQYQPAQLALMRLDCG